MGSASVDLENMLADLGKNLEAICNAIDARKQAFILDPANATLYKAQLSEFEEVQTKLRQYQGQLVRIWRSLKQLGL